MSLYHDILSPAMITFCYNPEGTLLVDGVSLDFINTTLHRFSSMVTLDLVKLQANLLFVAAPVVNIDGKVVGTVGAAISHAQVEELVQKFASPVTQLMTPIWSSDGLLLIASRGYATLPTKWIRILSHRQRISLLP